MPSRRVSRLASLLGLAFVVALFAACSGGSSAPPASLPDAAPTATVEPAAPALPTSGLDPIAGADLAQGTADLTDLVGALNDAEVALVLALDGGSTAAELEQLQVQMVSRALAVGRLADLLADAAGREEGAAARATSDMYTDAAGVAYALALAGAVTPPADMLDAEMAATVQSGIADAWMWLSTGDPDDEEVFRGVLGNAYPNDLVTVEVEGDDLPDAAVFASQGRDPIETDLESVLTLMLPDSGTEEALNAAIDPNTVMSLQELAGVAAARLSLFAGPAHQATVAGNTAPPTLSFTVARRLIMSKPGPVSNTQALRTFVALADPEDFADVWVLRGDTKPDGKKMAEVIFEIAVDAFGGRDDRPDLQFLADLLHYHGDELAERYPNLASTIQRILFDEYVAADEPVVQQTSARYDARTDTIVVMVSYSNPGRALTLICDGLDASESVVRIPKGSGQLAVVMKNEANPREHDDVEYFCRTKYGQVFNGEVDLFESPTPTDTPEPVPPTATVPAPPPPPAQPPPDEPPPPSGDPCAGLDPVLRALCAN